MRTKLCPVGAEEPRRAHDPRLLARRRLAVELRAPVRGERVRPVRLDVRRALAPVEDVVGRVVDERRAERGRVLRPADVHRRGALRVVLGAVDVRPRGGVQDELGRRLERRRRQRDVPVGARERDERRRRRTPPGARGRAGRRRPSGARGGVPLGEDRALRAPQVLHARIGPADAVLVRARPGRTPRSRGRRRAGR